MITTSIIWTYLLIDLFFFISQSYGNTGVQKFEKGYPNIQFAELEQLIGHFLYLIREVLREFLGKTRWTFPKFFLKAFTEVLGIPETYLVTDLGYVQPIVLQ